MENIENEVVRAKVVEEVIVPNWIKYFFGTLVYLWALYITLSQIKIIAEIFKESLGIGLLVLFSGVGVAFVMSPAIIAWMFPTFLIEWSEKAKSKVKMFFRLSIGLIGVIILPLVVEILVGLFIGYLLY